MERRGLGDGGSDRAIVTQPHLGIDVGGTTIQVVAVDRAAQVLAHCQSITNDDATDAWQQRVVDAYRSTVEKIGAPPASVGLCAPGIAAPDGSRIDWMPGRLAGLEGLDWQQRLGLDVPVRVLNDAQAALLGEVWIGAAKDSSNVTLLTLGTGVGGASMCGGKLLRGHLGRAGHWGHISLNPSGPPDICNTPGSLEYAVGNATLNARSGERWMDTASLLRAYCAGDEAAAVVWLDSVRALAAGIVSIGNAIDPELILLGGGIVQAGDALFEPLRGFLDLFEWRPGRRQMRIEAAALGDNAGAMGAAYYGMRFEELTF